MKNLAYKKFLLMFAEGKDLALILMFELMEQNQHAFEIMEEADAPFTMNGYEKAAKFLKQQMNDQIESVRN